MRDIRWSLLAPNVISARIHTICVQRKYAEGVASIYYIFEPFGMSSRYDIHEYYEFSAVDWQIQLKIKIRLMSSYNGTPTWKRCVRLHLIPRRSITRYERRILNVRCIVTKFICSIVGSFVPPTYIQCCFLHVSVRKIRLCFALLHV